MTDDRPVVVRISDTQFDLNGLNELDHEMLQRAYLNRSNITRLADLGDKYRGLIDTLRREIEETIGKLVQWYVLASPDGSVYKDPESRENWRAYIKALAHEIS